MQSLTTKEAVKYVLINNLVNSKYHLAKLLSIEPIMINNYLKKNTRMGVETAATINELFNIVITDVYDSRSKA